MVSKNYCPIWVFRNNNVELYPAEKNTAVNPDLLTQGSARSSGPEPDRAESNFLNFQSPNQGARDQIVSDIMGSDFEFIIPSSFYILFVVTFQFNIYPKK